jgi:hypothetical protein
MPTLTWTGKEDALRAASLVPCSIVLLKKHHPVLITVVVTGQIEVEAATQCK